MTEDELDLLASAYLDGEATPEEVALVERDPDLLARVDAMRAVSGQLGPVPGPPPALKEQHLAAALAAFDATADLGAAADGNVLDYQAKARVRKTTDRKSRRRFAGAGGLPSWMPAAAVFVLITGGVIALVSSQSGDDDSFDTAADSSDESTEAGAESAEVDRSAGEGDSDTAALAETEAADDAAPEQEEMADDEEAMEEDAGGEDAESAADDAGSAASTTTARNQFIPQEPVLIIDVPLIGLDLDALIANLPELIDPVESNCAERLELGPDLEPGGYVPVLVAGRPAELFAIVDSAGEETGRLFEAETCTPLE